MTEVLATSPSDTRRPRMETSPGRNRLLAISWLPTLSSVPVPGIAATPPEAGISDMRVAPTSAIHWKRVPIGRDTPMDTVSTSAVLSSASARTAGSPICATSSPSVCTACPAMALRVVRNGLLRWSSVPVMVQLDGRSNVPSSIAMLSAL